MSSMFYNCTSLTSLDVSNFNTSNVTNMSSMFSSCSKLTSLDLSSFNTSKVTDVGGMFSGCTSLTTINASGIVLPNTTAGMFSGLSSLQTLNLSNTDTSNVTSMRYMFSDCESLTSLDLSNFNTSNVTDMSYMFSDCTSLTGLDLSNFNTSNVTSMSNMFSDCTSLTSLDVSNFDTSKVTDMHYMFSDCTSLTSLDVSNFNTSNVTDMDGMFWGCTSLTSLDLSSFDMTTSGSNMFVMTYISVIYAPKVANTDVSLCKTYYYLDANGEIQSTSELISQIGTEKTKLVKNEYDVFNNVLSSDWKNKIKSVYSDFIANCQSIKITTKSEPTNYTSKIWVGNLTEENDPIYAYVTINGTSYDVIIYGDVETIYAPVKSNSLFSSLSNCKTITFENFDTSNVINMSYMFNGCSSLININLNTFDTSKLQSNGIFKMFSGCENLQTIDISNWDLSGITTNTTVNLFAKSYEPDDIVYLWYTEIMLITNPESAETFGSEPLDKEGCANAYANALGVTFEEAIELLSSYNMLANIYSQFLQYYILPNEVFSMLEVEAKMQEVAATGITDQNELIVTVGRKLLEEKQFDNLIADDVVLIWYSDYVLKSGLLLDFSSPMTKSELIQYRLGTDTSTYLDTYVSISEPDSAIQYYQLFLENYALPQGLITMEEVEAEAARIATEYGITDQTQLMVMAGRSLMYSKVNALMLEDPYYGPIIREKCNIYSSSTNVDNISFESIALPEKMGAVTIILPYEMSVYNKQITLTQATNEYEGEILVKSSIEPILPPSIDDIDPDTPESGVTLVDLLILTMLTLTLSGVCVIILKNKNKGLIKR